MALNEEQKKYYTKLAQDAGFDEGQTKQFLEVLGNDKIGQGIVPRPEFSRGLDQERQKAATTQARLKHIEEDWLPKAQRAHEINLQGIERLRLYEQTYGEIDPKNPGQVRHAATGSGLSKEDVDRMLAERLERELAQRDRGYLEFEEIRDLHREEFGKRLPVKDFENFVEQQKQSGDFQGLRQAYSAFTQEERTTLEQKRIDDEVNRRFSEKVRDYESTHHIPADPRPSEPHLIHDADRLRQEADKEGAVSGRDAFLETMRAGDGYKELERS